MKTLEEQTLNELYALHADLTLMLENEQKRLKSCKKPECRACIRERITQIQEQLELLQTAIPVRECAA